MDGRKEPAIRIAQIGHGIERHIRHGLAEHHVEDDQRIDRALAKAAGLRKAIGAE